MHVTDNTNRSVAHYLLAVVTFLSFSSILSAQDTVFSVGKTGVYVSFSLPKTAIGGDFDGSSIVYTASEVNAVPKIDSKFAGSFGLGYRGERFALEFTYSSTTNDATFLGYSADVEITSYGLNARSYTKPFTLAGKTAQAYLLSGLVIAPLTVKEGSVSEEYYGSIIGGDATYHSYGALLGLGLESALGQRLRVSADVGYRLLRYFSVTGAGGSATPIAEALSGSGFATSIGASLVLF